MTGRRLFLPLVVALLMALGWQTMRWRNRLEASAIVARVEVQTQAAIARRRAPSTLFAAHLADLDRAWRLAPSDVSIPIAVGAQYLLLKRADDAINAYEIANALEPRPEIDLNLGRAYQLRGDVARARAAFARVVRLNPVLAREVPPEHRTPATP